MVTNEAANGKTDNENKPQDRLDAPSENPKPIEQPLLLLLRICFAVLMYLPIIIWSTVEYWFFSKRKPVEGQVVLITGTGRGLGRGFALHFAALGCKVACVDIDDLINKETVDMVNKMYPGSAKQYKCNLAFPAEIKELKKEVVNDFGQVDIVVHNAAVITSRKITDFDDKYINGVIAVNLTSHFYMIREFLPDMQKRNSGHFASVASVAGFSTLPYLSAYAATKHGVFGLLETLDLELKENPYNQVKTSVICPSFVNTSALYSRFYTFKLPELSIEEVVSAAVDGILRNRRVITIPTIIYYVMHWFKLHPDRIGEMFRNATGVQIRVPTKEMEQKMPLFKLLMASVGSFDTIFQNKFDESVREE